MYKLLPSVFRLHCTACWFQHQTSRCERRKMPTWQQTQACRAFTARLGLQHPIVLAPMAGVSTPALTAAVSNEGGLGMFGAATTPLKDLPKILTDIKSLLKPDKQFGVNLFTPPTHIPALTAEQQQALEAVHKYYTGMVPSLHACAVMVDGTTSSALHVTQGFACHDQEQSIAGNVDSTHGVSTSLKQWFLLSCLDCRPCYTAQPAC